MAHEFWNDQPSLELAQDVVVTSAGQVLEGYDAVLVRGQYPNEVENVTAPAITGSPAVGQTLTASPGTWNLQAHDLPLPVARRHHSRRHRLRHLRADRGRRGPGDLRRGHRCRRRHRQRHGDLGRRPLPWRPRSPTLRPPPPPPAAKKVLLVKKPAIKGSLVVGTKARVTHGTWNPATVVLKYQWYVGGKLVAKADGARLLLKEKWAGQRLRVKVVAKADGYLKAAVLTKRSPQITG